MASKDAKYSSLEKKVDTLLRTVSEQRKEIELLKTCRRHGDTIVVTRPGTTTHEIVGEYTAARITMIGAGSSANGTNPGLAGQYVNTIVDVTGVNNITTMVGSCFSMGGGEDSIVVLERAVQGHTGTTTSPTRTAVVAKGAAPAAESIADKGVASQQGRQGSSVVAGDASTRNYVSPGGRGGGTFKKDDAVSYVGEPGSFGSGGGSGSVGKGVQHPGGAGGSGFIMIELL